MKVLLDLDPSLYRYMRVSRFLKMLETDQIGMLTTDMWQKRDPFEGFLFDQYVGKWPDSSHKGLRKSVYCLCFSRDMEKDQIWRSYTPRGDGVRVKVKVSGLREIFDDSFVLGDVKYKNRGSMKRVLEDCLAREDQGEEGLRNLFFYKFLGFQNDKEVRLLTIDHDNSGNVKNVSVDVCNTFQNILFDPRMPESCYKRLRAEIEKTYEEKGQKVKIQQSSLYSPEKHLTL